MADPAVIAGMRITAEARVASAVGRLSETFDVPPPDPVVGIASKDRSIAETYRLSRLADFLSAVADKTAGGKSEDARPVAAPSPKPTPAAGEPRVVKPVPAPPPTKTKPEAKPSPAAEVKPTDAKRPDIK